MSPHLLQNSLIAGLKAVRLETFDEAGALLTRASGFLINESDGLFLYTGWHVVTGVDFLQPTPISLPKRRATIKLYCQDVHERPQIRSIGGEHSIELPLY